MDSLKYWLTWVAGVVVSVFALSIWQGEKIDWESMINMSVAGLVGVLISTWIKNAVNKGKNKARDSSK